MVQRKALNKLGIQADQVKSEKLLGNLKLATSYSCQQQDGKNRSSSDMKKKMKRSRPIKLSDIGGLKLSSLPGKPPPINVQTPAASTKTKQKQPTRREANGSPNYMKSTSSSEARKERSPVSFLNSQTGSSNKPTKLLKKSSSLKLVRTLTRIPSFKPVRGTNKRSSRVALCGDMNVQKATCSSTLKDSKFPEYLMLNAGGTEAEGTSVIKVCPYTYCSLNGHCHTPLPPLKCFLEARRRSMKTQKSMKLEVLSPSKERDYVDSNKVPVIEDVGMDFFIEIYAQDTYEAKEESAEKNNVETSQFTLEPEETNEGSWFCCGNKVETEPDTNEEALESGTTSVEMDVTGGLPEDQIVEDSDAEDMPNLSQEIAASLSQDEGFSEPEDMEGVQEQFAGSELDAKGDNSIPEDKIEQLSETMKFDLHGKAELTGSDEEITADQSASSDAFEELRDMEEEDTSSTTNSVCGLPCAASNLAPIQESRACAEDAHEDADGQVDDEVLTRSNYRGSIEDSTTDMKDGVSDDYEDDVSAENDEETKWIQNLTDDSGQTCNEIADDETDEDYNKGQPGQEMEMATNLGVGSLEQEVNMPEAGDTIDDLDQSACGGIPYEGRVSNQFACTSDSDQDYTGESNSHNCLVAERHKPDGDAKDSNSSHGLSEDCSSAEHCNHPLENQNCNTDFIRNPNAMEEGQDGATKIRIVASTDPEENGDTNVQMKSDGNDTEEEVENTEEDCSESNTAETFLHSKKDTSSGPKCKFLCKRSKPRLELPSIGNIRRWTISHKNPAMTMEDERKFNPREPNFLPAVPDPEAEKVDLKHQMMDDRKNSEEWMLDYALQQAVTKLAPARKRKVALLVEAFEAVLPIPKYDNRNSVSHTTTAFSARPIQACS